MILRCPACRSPRTEARLEKQGVAILFCDDCGTGFWSPDDDFSPKSIYGADYFEGAPSSAGYDDYRSLEATLRSNFARRLRSLGAPPHSGARLLDLGPAFGYAVDEARRAGWRAVGLELSGAAARRAAETIGKGGIAIGDAQRAPFPDGSFDAITLWDVIEHLASPDRAVAEMARLLRPRGRLALTTGDVGSLVARISGRRWHLYTIPEHVCFFSREGLRRLFEAHGFRIRTMRAETSWYPIGYLMERLRKSLLGQVSRKPSRFPGAAIALPVNLFDVVTVCAVRGSA